MKTRGVLACALAVLVLALTVGGFGKASAATDALIFECVPQANGAFTVAAWSGTGLAPALSVGLSCATAFQRLFTAGFTMQIQATVGPNPGVIYTFIR